MSFCVFSHSLMSSWTGRLYQTSITGIENKIVIWETSYWFSRIAMKLSSSFQKRFLIWWQIIIIWYELNSHQAAIEYWDWRDTVDQAVAGEAAEYSIQVRRANTKITFSSLFQQLSVFWHSVFWRKLTYIKTQSK